MEVAPTLARFPQRGRTCPRSEPAAGTNVTPEPWRSRTETDARTAVQAGSAAGSVVTGGQRGRKLKRKKAKPSTKLEKAQPSGGQRGGWGWEHGVTPPTEVPEVIVTWALSPCARLHLVQDRPRGACEMFETHQNEMLRCEILFKM